MNAMGWIQLALYVGILLAITKPLGIYLLKVLDPRGKTFLDPVIRPIERLLYKLFGVDPMTRAELEAVLGRDADFQRDLRRLHLRHLAAAGHAPLSTRSSMACPTRRRSPASGVQHGRELHDQHQLAELRRRKHDVVFLADGGAGVAQLLVGGGGHRDRRRAGPRHRPRQGQTIGNFWVDLVRLHLYLLMPICIVYALFLVSQGMIQNFKPYTAVTVLDQSSAAPQFTGPADDRAGADGVADRDQDARHQRRRIYNANAAHPFENPTPLSNFIQILSIFAIPSGLTYYLGRMVKNQKHGWAVWAAMFMLFLAGR